MFIYYMFYKFWKLLSFGLTKMNYRAAFFIALFTTLNFLVFLRYIGVTVIIENNLYFIFIFILWVLFNLLFFGNEKIHSSVVNKYINKDLTHHIIYGLITAMYVIVSIYLILI